MATTLRPWGAIEGIASSHRHEFAQRALELAKDAVRLQGVQTLMLPPARVTAAHEAGHAIVYAASGEQVGCITIRERRSLGGWSGFCELANPMPDRLTPFKEPHRALLRASVEIAGWCGELAFEPSGFRCGSSIDEFVLVGGLVSGVAQALECDPERLFHLLLAAVVKFLQEEKECALAIQRTLVREGRIRGPKLAALLATVRRCDMTDLIFGFQP